MEDEQADDESSEPTGEAAGDEEAAEGDAEEADSPSSDSEELAELVGRWLTDVSGEWAEDLGEGAEVSPGEASTADAEKLAAVVESAPVAVLATAKTSSAEVPFALMAGEAAVLVIAGRALEEEVEELDEKAMTAYGEVVRGILGRLEAAWKAEGAEDLAVEAGEPQRVEELGEQFSAGQTCLGVAAVKIEDAEAFEFQLLLPAGFVEVFPSRSGAEAVQEAELAPGTARLLRISVPLVVEIAQRKAAVSEVLGFKPGSVVEFDKKSDDLLELLAGKAHIGRGEAVKVGESFGIRVLQINDVRERIQGLG